MSPLVSVEAVSDGAIACPWPGLQHATQADHGDPDDDQLIPLTYNEIRRLFTGCASSRPHPESSCTGHDGDAATDTPPEPATTGNEPDLAHITARSRTDGTLS